MHECGEQLYVICMSVYQLQDYRLIPLEESVVVGAFTSLTVAIVGVAEIIGSSLSHKMGNKNKLGNQ